MLTIYGAYRSRATRPLWLLHEIGLPFRHLPVIQSYRVPDAQAADAPLNTGSPEFLKINPQGLVPCMDEDGLVLTESLAITLYIAKRHGGDLGPRDLAEDAAMTMWALVGATSVESPGLEMMQLHGRGEQDTPEGRARIEASVKALARPFALIEAHLAGRDWLVGGRFTAADVMLAECARYAQSVPAAFDGFPRLTAWLARCQDRPAFKTMMANRLAEPM